MTIIKTKKQQTGKISRDRKRYKTLSKKDKREWLKYDLRFDHLR